MYFADSKREKSFSPKRGKIEVELNIQNKKTPQDNILEMLGFLKGSVSFWCIRSDPIFNMLVLNLFTFLALPSVLSLTGSFSISGRSPSIFSVMPLCLLISHSSSRTGIYSWSAQTIYSFSFYTVEKLDIWVLDVDAISAP